MKIVEIAYALNVRAGAEVFISQLSPQLEKEGNEIYLIVLTGSLDSSYAYLKDTNIKIIFLNKKIGFDLKKARELKRIISEINPDIVHLHNGSIVSYFFAFGLKKRKWKPVITIHNVGKKAFTKYEFILINMFQKKKLLHFVGISSLIVEEFKKLYPKCEISNIYNGIVLPSDAKVSYNPKYDFVMVGRFEEQKNHEMAIRVFAKLHEKHSAANLLLLGDGSKKEMLLELVKQLSCSENVIFKGTVPNVYKYLSQSKVFVLSSLWEGNPISVLEAMAYGLPCLLPSVGGIPDVVKHEKNGLLFQPGNETEMLDCMERLYVDSALRNGMEQNNLTDVKKYSIEECAHQYCDLFKKLIS